MIDPTKAIPLMKRVIPFAALAAATIAVAAPAGAQAATHAIVAGPITVHGYELSVLGIAGSPVLTVMLEQDRGTTTQVHLFTVKTGVHSSTKRIRADLGALGAIDLRLGAKRTRHLPAGCRGSAQRVGTWTGSLRLVPDTTFFKTIRATRLPGAVLKGAGLECDEPGSSTPDTGETGPQLVTGGTGPGIAADTTTTTVTANGRRGSASVVHLLTQRSTLVTAADLTTATLTPIGAAITGTATFAGTTTAVTTVDGPIGRTAKGTLTGTLTAHFDSIGDIAVGPTTTAMLEELP
jgi:hypothetical protein